MMPDQSTLRTLGLFLKGLSEGSAPSPGDSPGCSEPLIGPCCSLVVLLCSSRKSLSEETAVVGRMFHETLPSLFFIHSLKLSSNVAAIIRSGCFRTTMRMVATVSSNSSLSLASTLAITRYWFLTSSRSPGDTLSRLSDNFELVILMLHSCS